MKHCGIFFISLLVSGSIVAMEVDRAYDSGSSEVTSSQISDFPPSQKMLYKQAKIKSMQKKDREVRITTTYSSARRSLFHPSVDSLSTQMQKCTLSNNN